MNMNYIVLDLEWNQCPSGKEHSVDKLTFEIIEIGAYKLDSSLKLVDKFDELVKPQVYTKIHSIIGGIFKYTMEELNEKGDYFEFVIKRFLDWCGEDYIFCTWGPQDLTELQRNIRFYNLKYKFDYPLCYLDLQKLFSIKYEDGKTRRSLEYAVEYLNIDKDIPFHHAIDDVCYTTEILKKMKLEGLEKYYSIDLYRKPASKKEEIHIVYDTYYKYISRAFGSKEKAMLDREVKSARCYLCDREESVRNMTKIANWFSDSSKTYYFLGECEQHGFIKGKIRMKKTEDDRVYVVKTLKATDMDGASQVLEKQLAIREKRRRKRLGLGEEG